MENKTMIPTFSTTESLQSSPSVNNPMQQRAVPNHWKTVALILGVLLVVSVGITTYLYLQKTSSQLSTNESERMMKPEIVLNSQENNNSLATETSAEMETYTSDTENISFQYPADWIVIPSVESDVDDTDRISLRSPSGEVTLNWVSYIDGLGGLCDENAELGTEGNELRTCPLITVIEKTPIVGAPELVVASGTITHDGKIFMPWVAVQHKDVTTRRGMEMGTFLGRNNEANALFSTAGITLGGPELNKVEAESYFDKSEVKQAKKIMLSLEY